MLIKSLQLPHTPCSIKYSTSTTYIIGAIYLYSTYTTIVLSTVTAACSKIAFWMIYLNLLVN
jgi:hypothetical protein